MQFTEAGVALPFEVTYDSPSLFVAMNVFDVTTGTPVLVVQVPMLNFSGNSYFAQFTPTAAKSYAVNKSVYTDGTYVTVDTDYSQGSDSFRADDFAGLFLDAIINNYQELGSVGVAIKEASQGGGGGGGTTLIVGATLQGTVSVPNITGIVETPDLEGET